MKNKTEAISIQELESIVLRLNFAIMHNTMAMVSTTEVQIIANELLKLKRAAQPKGKRVSDK